MGAIKAVLFDKDGTLFDFQATWADWSRRLLDELAGGDAARAEGLGRSIGFDYTRAEFAPDSPVIAATPDEIADALLPGLTPGAYDHAGLVARMNALAAGAVQAPAVPLVPLFQEMTRLGLRLGLATNDAEIPARAHLAAAGVTRYFDFVAGFDSGHGAKPGPGQMLAFAALTGLPPAHIAMVGDSRHDLIAGRAAGMAVVAVLTGVASHDELAPLADVVLPDIGYLPEWLGVRAAAVAAAR